VADTAGYGRAFAVSALLLVAAAAIALTVLPRLVRNAPQPAPAEPGSRPAPAETESQPAGAHAVTDLTAVTD
jgi:hypothetical protein